jgi:hydroxyacylglutathione hydrolase
MIRLIGRLNLVSGGEISHPWDANAYLITGDEPVLIDCGGSEGYPSLKSNLRQLGYEPGDVRKVVATHGHWDHLSAMARIREESGALLLVHAADKEQVATGDPDLTVSFLYDRPFPPAEVNGLLEDGACFRRADTGFM